jgi:hypothetical protein
MNQSDGCKDTIGIRALSFYTDQFSSCVICNGYLQFNLLKSEGKLIYKKSGSYISVTFLESGEGAHGYLLAFE